MGIDYRDVETGLLHTNNYLMKITVEQRPENNWGTGIHEDKRHGMIIELCKSPVARIGVFKKSLNASGLRG